MEEAYKIFSYLPLLYKSNEEAEYVQYLWKAFENNYQNGQYQFAFMSYHMLFMCFVYFTVWKIKSIHPDDFDKITLGFNDCLNSSSSPFGYSEEQESKIMQVLKYWGLNERIGEYKKLVKERNDIAHSNGNIYYKDQKSVDDRIDDVLRFCGEIHRKTKTSIEHSYILFLRDNYSVEDSPYSTIEEMLSDEYIRIHYISENDIKYCCECSMEGFNTHKEKDSIIEIHREIQTIYQVE